MSELLKDEKAKEGKEKTLNVSYNKIEHADLFVQSLTEKSSKKKTKKVDMVTVK